MKDWIKTYWHQTVSAFTILLVGSVMAALGYASQARMAEIVRSEFKARGVVSAKEFEDSRAANSDAHKVINERLDRVETTLSDYKSTVLTNQTILLDIRSMLQRELPMSTNRPGAGGWRY